MSNKKSVKIKSRKMLLFEKKRKGAEWYPYRQRKHTQKLFSKTNQNCNILFQNELEDIKKIIQYKGK